MSEGRGSRSNSGRRSREEDVGIVEEVGLGIEDGKVGVGK